MAFKMKGSPFQRNYNVGSPMKQDKMGLKESTTATEDTRTDAEKAKDQAGLERETRIQTRFQNTAAHTKRRKTNSVYNLGYYQGDDGKMVYPFGEDDKMDKEAWNEWKSKDENKPYKGKTKGLIEVK